MPERIERGYMSSRSQTDKKRRVQIDFTERALRELDELAARLGSRSRADAIRNAIAALKWIYRKKVEEGLDVVAIGKDDRVFEPEFGFLPESRGIRPASHPSTEKEAA